MFKPVPSRPAKESYDINRTSRTSSEKDLWLIIVGVHNRLIDGLWNSTASLGDRNLISRRMEGNGGFCSEGNTSTWCLLSDPLPGLVHIAQNLGAPSSNSRRFGSFLTVRGERTGGPLSAGKSYKKELHKEIQQFTRLSYLIRKVCHQYLQCIACIDQPTVCLQRGQVTCASK